MKNNSNITRGLVDRDYSRNKFSKNGYLNGRLKEAKNLYRTDLLAHYGCVNAIEFSQDGQFLASGGDDRRVLLWNVSKAIEKSGEPTVLLALHLSNIFCLAFDSNNSKIFSAGNDDQVIVHDVRTRTALDIFRHLKPVYGLSIKPDNDNIFTSSGEDGRLLTFDLRASVEEPSCLASSRGPFHAVMYNPIESRLLVSANTKDGFALWDSRLPKLPLMEYGESKQTGMSVRWNRLGTQILALRRRQPPVLYAFDRVKELCHFNHTHYRNSCTMKSCCFAGANDDFVLSGSDDFNLYMWKIDENLAEHSDVERNAHVILSGHRSIVNQVRYNYQHCFIASSGVEKMVKVWSPIARPKWQGCDNDGSFESARDVSTDLDVSFSTSFISHDYSHQSTSEDSRMLAFFDALLQREQDGFDSDHEQNVLYDLGNLSSVSSEVAGGASRDSSPESVLGWPNSSSESEREDNISSQTLPKTSNETLSGERVRERRVALKKNRIAQLIAQKRSRLVATNKQKVTRIRARNRFRRSQTNQRKRIRFIINQKRNERRKVKSNAVSRRRFNKQQSNRLRQTQQSNRMCNRNRNNETKWKQSTPPMSNRNRNKQIKRQQSNYQQSNALLDIPSTSTGITASNSSKNSSKISSKNSSYRSYLSSDSDADYSHGNINNNNRTSLFSKSSEVLFGASSSRSSVESDSGTSWDTYFKKLDKVKYGSKNKGKLDRTRLDRCKLDKSRDRVYSNNGMDCNRNNNNNVIVEKINANTNSLKYSISNRKRKVSHSNLESNDDCDDDDDFGVKFDDSSIRNDVFNVRNDVSNVRNECCGINNDSSIIKKFVSNIKIDKVSDLNHSCSETQAVNSKIQLRDGKNKQTIVDDVCCSNSNAIINNNINGSNLKLKNGFEKNKNKIENGFENELKKEQNKNDRDTLNENGNTIDENNAITTTEEKKLTEKETNGTISGVANMLEENSTVPLHKLFACDFDGSSSGGELDSDSSDNKFICKRRKRSVK